MTDELQKAAGHVATITAGLAAIKAHATENNDATLLALEASLHEACAAARADYLAARQADQETVSAFSGGDGDKTQPSAPNS